jgi:dCTP deaminase
MSVYSNIEIRKALEQGHIVCHPLIKENIRGSSIDMTLGEWYFNCERITGLQRGFYNPFEVQDVDAYFGDVQKAKPIKETYKERYDLSINGIPDDHPVIIVPRKSRILAHSHEFIGIHPPGTTEMRARSSWGRNGIAVALCSGWGDPGYINRWTMEIHNFNDEAIPLPVGERIAQMIFYETGQVDGHYGDNGKYQGSTEIEEIIRAWTPDSMLPRSYADERRLPLPI